MKSIFKESADLKLKTAEALSANIEKSAQTIISALKNGKKVIIFGNGGSAADAQHMAAELLGRFKMNRKALPAIALSTNSSSVTAIANDFGYDLIFEKPVEGLTQAGDVVIGISTSGESKNVIKGIEKAKSLGAKTIGLSGCSGGKLAAVSEIALTVPSNDTPRIQEAHITIIHIICGLVEEELFG
ncbi:MAG: D-sedoheptulose 7-phosphate isomerase [Candidatus Margulisbacteria bacterium]|nr:D-sedoheptulose 7-phosphate isomerase [Candidatus Margulisiibacteriota bacterium]MBU1022163.1 D-sedoheptulose 7-phosphate isomerase [Candidatus Margulisiibacteriota bacterium]MBU1729398.1 D-sedoheptulose 7-phosphate isomerase [Candidatus Margulisiibacteriota bacterium]MBU1955671.1 D-sedoheptulose 7-phosphate isomerase [Candidatus Margulisiibacteriota bacterium]